MTPEDLKEALSRAKTQQEKAAIEVRAWATVPRSERSAYQSLTGFSAAAGEIGGEAGARSSLYNASRIADPLWHRIDVEKTMTLRNAARMLREARKKASSTGATIEATLGTMIAEYDTLPIVRTADGTVFRKAVSGAAKAKHDKKRNRNGTPPEHTAEWETIRRALKTIIDLTLAGVPEGEQEMLRSQIEAEMSALLRLLQMRVVTAGERAPAVLHQTASGREKLREACMLLGINPPRAGKLVDHVSYMKAKKQMQRLAAQYHPDSHGGDESMRPQYEHVIAAMHCIENYNDSLRASGEEQE